MKNICILSMQRVNNFGSLLQSYSLKKFLESFGTSVEFIDIKANIEDNNLLKTKIITNEEKSAKKSKLLKIDKFFLNRLIIKKKDNLQNEKFEEFRIRNLNIDEKSNNKKFDTCIIGSDEVFNCATNKSWGFTSQLFGNVDNAAKVITYAASCGGTRFSDLSEASINKINNSFKKIYSFSVRDKNTEEFVKKLTNKKVINSLDPVLIGNFDKEIKENSNIKLPNKFCIIYSYYNRIDSKEEIKEIKKFCKQNNMKIITLGAPQFWTSNHIVLNPFELLYAFSKAEFVITDTFHGTIFASKYSKKFATIVRKSNENKLVDLIKRLEKNKHLCKNIKDINEIYLVNNDINRTNEICENARKESIEYLKNNI